MAVIRKSFNNFFIIEDRIAIDLGNSLPKSAITSNNPDKLAIIREFKTGGNSASTSSRTRDQLIDTAKNIVDGDAGRKLRAVILGKSLGKKFKGKTVFKDFIGFTFKR